jgi:hypothetical protein
MVFSTGTGPSKDSSDQTRIRKYLDAARNSRSFGCDRNRRSVNGTNLKPAARL